MKNLLILILVAVSSLLYGQKLPAPTPTPTTLTQFSFSVSPDSSLNAYSGTTWLWWKILSKYQGDKLYMPISGAGFVPTSRTLTIAGVTQDLSANRTYTLAALTSGYGLSTAGTYTGATARTIIVDSTLLASKSYVQGNFAPIGSPISLAAFGSTPNDNGLSLSGNVLNMQPADTTHAGGVSIAANQIFQGNKFVKGILGTFHHRTTVDGVLELGSDDPSVLAPFIGAGSETTAQWLEIWGRPAVNVDNQNPQYGLRINMSKRNVSTPLTSGKIVGMQNAGTDVWSVDFEGSTVQPGTFTGTSGTWISNATNIQNISPATGTNGLSVYLHNTGGDNRIGIASSTGTSFASGTTNYAAFAGTNTATDYQLVTNGFVRQTIASGGGTTFTGTVTSPTFIGALTGNATTATTATNLAAGSGGTIPYQSAAGTTAMLANGTAGQILQSNGTTLAPSWTSTPALTGYVPYTGATSNVNLGAHSLTVDGTGADIVIKKGNALVFWDNSNTYDTQIYANAGSGTNVILFPAASGTVALTSALATYAPIASPTFTGTVTIPNGSALGTPTTLVGTNITGTASGLSIGGSAATLTTPRTIGGVSFNGSANITVASATGGFAVSGGNLTLGSNAITGVTTLGLSGLITSTAASGNIFTNTSGGTSNIQMRIGNTGSNLYYGVAASDGTSPFTGTTAYSAFIGQDNATNLELVAGGNVRQTISSAGVVTIHQLGTGAVQSTAGVLSVVSDSKAKDLHGKFKGSALSAIANMEVGQYWNYNKKSELGDNAYKVKQFGFLADEVHASLGEEFAPPQTKFVTDKVTKVTKEVPVLIDGKQVYGLSTTAIIALQNQAIQELLKRVEALEKK